MLDWLPKGHLVWFILDAVDQLGLSSFHRRYCQDGWGRAARSEFRLMCGCCNLLKLWRAVLAGGRWRRMGTSLLEKGKTALATAVLTEKTLSNRLCSANMLMIGNVPLEIAVIELC